MILENDIIRCSILYFLVFQYLERNCVTEFGRDNFSFNTKVNVGEFFENRAGGENVSSFILALDDKLNNTK